MSFACGSPSVCESLHKVERVIVCVVKDLIWSLCPDEITMEGRTWTELCSV